MVKKNHSHTKTYIVQDILDTKINNGAQFYKVKWKGYSLGQCTWEPEDSFNCSRDILNQFLFARATKEPAFREKLARIEMEKEAYSKNGPKGLDKTKSIKKSEKKQKNDSDSDQENDDQIEEKREQSEEIEGDSQESQEKEEKHSQSRKIPRDSQVKNQEDKHTTTKSPPNATNSTKEQSRYKQTSNNSEQSYSKSKSSSFGQKQQSSSQSIPPIEIMLIKKDKEDGGLKFYVKENGKKMWKDREEMHERFCRVLCEYYEKHLSFDE